MTRQTALKLWLCAVLLILAVFLSLNVTRSITELGGVGRESTEPSAAPAAAMGARESGGFVLREHEGYICVFSPDSDSLLTLTDIETSALRERDRVQLRDGITVDSYEAMLMLLEDFGS